MLKKQGEVIWGFANGINLSPVLAQPAANKGYGNSTTPPYDVTDVETADRVLLALSETVGNRLRTGRVSGTDCGRQLNLFDEIDYEKLSRMVR